MTAGFLIAVAALIALGVLMLRPAWRPAPAGPAAKPARLILDEQLAALDAEHAAGQIDAQQHAHLRLEWQRRVLDEAIGEDTAIGTVRSPKSIALVAFAVPVFAIALYAALGDPSALNVQVTRLAAQAATEPDVTPEAVQAMLASLEQRLQTPSADAASDLKGWTMLGRSYAALQRFADADRAYARAIALAPRDAQLLADRADVIAAQPETRGGTESDRLVAEALRIDPKNLKALALAGGAAFERKDFAAAIDYWQTARALAPEGSEFAAGLDGSLRAAREAGGDKAQDKTGAAPAVVEAAARITGRVSLAPQLAARAAPTDTVFVFARAAEGSRMPLAIVRRSVADLPFTFALDDSQAMSPQTRLSTASRVIVGARISRSGQAMPQAGDLRGESPAVGTRTDDVQLVIDTVQP